MFAVAMPTACDRVVDNVNVYVRGDNHVRV